MSGHSKWATIKRKKGEADAKKGKVFTKLVREITTAARLGGSDLSGNPRLRLAILAGKRERMPADNIERAIKKGTGALEGPPVEDVTYEGYGPAGVAVLVLAQTDNRNRTSAEVRAAFTKGGGNMGTSGSVAWQFRSVGQVVVDVAVTSESVVFEAALAGGASDVRQEQDAFHIDCDPKDFSGLLDSLERAEVACAHAAIEWVADSQVRVDGEQAQMLLRLVERLEELEDVQEVHANFDMDPQLLARLGRG